MKGQTKCQVLTGVVVANTHSATARTLIQRAMRSRATWLPKGQSMEADEDTYSPPRQAEIGPIPTRGGAAAVCQSGRQVPVAVWRAELHVSCGCHPPAYVSPTCLRALSVFSSPRRVLRPRLCRSSRHKPNLWHDCDHKVRFSASTRCPAASAALAIFGAASFA